MVVITTTRTHSQGYKLFTENNAKVMAAKAAQDNTINTLIADREKFDELNKELQLDLDKANSYKNTLIDKLRKHDLAKLSMKKPGLVEKKINNGTKKLFRSLESLTGATPPTPLVK
tara:strand:- start:2916 stop:3263 length:348 start_codon:yes stop_codon:yes gene_type:complete